MRVIPVVAALMCGQLQPSSATGTSTGAVTDGPSSLVERGRALLLPADLPLHMRPDASGCDRQRPGRTKEECRRWVVSLWEYQRDDWNKIGRETLVRLCDAKCARCCETLAEWLRLGIGGPADSVEEQRCRNDACRLGRKAQCSVDVNRDLDRERARREQMLRDCNAGSAQACFAYGAKKWDHDRSESGLTFFDKACSLGMELGCMRARAARTALQGLGPR